MTAAAPFPNVPDIGTPGLPPPRQFRTIDDVAQLLRADFAANGIGAVVEADTWQPEWHKGEPRVVVGYESFTFEPPRGTDQPGWSIEIPDGTGDVARAILDDCERYHVWCHHNGDGMPGGEPQPLRARRGAKDLLVNTVRAIYDALATPLPRGPFRSLSEAQRPGPGLPRFRLRFLRGVRRDDSFPRALRPSPQGRRGRDRLHRIRQHRRQRGRGWRRTGGSMTAQQEAPRPTTTGACVLCGSGSCKFWRFAVLTADKHVDMGALHTAHDIAPAEVEHDAAGKVIGGAVQLVPMAAAQTASHKKNGGRIAPLPVRKARR